MLGACLVVIGVGVLIAALAPGVALRYSCWRYRRARDAWYRPVSVADKEPLLRTAVERLLSSGATWKMTRRMLGEPGCVTFGTDGSLVAHYPYVHQSETPGWSWEIGCVLTFRHGRLASAERSIGMYNGSEYRFLWCWWEEKRIPL